MMIKNCLISRQEALPLYRRRPQIFDFTAAGAYNPALSIPTILQSILQTTLKNP
jgi:hypothetical protein